MNELMILLGLGLFAIATLLLVAGFLAEKEEGNSHTESEVGGVVIIGPLPIVFGSSKKAATVAALLGLLLLIFSIILTLILQGVPPYG